MKPDGYPEADVVFDADEDNNPFSHVGIASLMGEVLSKAGEDVSAVANVGTDSSTEDNDHEHENDDDDNDEDDLLYNATVPSKDAFNAIPMHFESRVTDLLKPNSKVTIQITEAGNSNEGVVNSLKKYVVYTIKLINVNDRLEEILTRRRYSEFELLRLVLTKIFPLIIVPPIPPKNYVSFNVFNGLVGPNVQSNTSSSTNNLYINSTHLNSTKLIEHRKRLLANFLNNCLEIAQIRNLEFFSKFLDPNSNWVDEINLISSQLPKSIYLLNPENGLRTDAIYSHLPVPSGDTMSFLKDNRKKLTKKTNKLLSNGGANSNNNGNGTLNGITETVDTTSASSSIPSTFEGNKKYIVDTSNLDELNRKIMENYIGLSYDYTELGTIFNSFSLELADSSPPDPSKTETDETKLNVILDKIGQGFDRLYITINALIGDLETKFSEPLGEVVQYSTILHFISRYQLKKIKQKQLLDNDLKEKRIALDELVLAEQESGRVEGITNSRPLAKNDTYDFEGAAPGRSSKFKFPNINSIKKLTQYVADIIDQNPEQTRKQKLTNLEQKITVLEKCQGIMLEDISYIADELHKNFRVFHTKQLRMIYEILLCYNRFLIGWAKKNMDIWEEVKEEVQKL